MQQDWAFLQPFLGLGEWHTSSAPHSVTEEEMNEGYLREYQKLPENVRLWLPFDAFLKQKGKLEAQVKAAVLTSRSSAPKSSLGYAQKRFEKTAFMRLFNSATNHFGWFNLAAQFTGICIGVRPKASCFQAMPGVPVVLQPVQYGKSHQFQSSEHNPLPGAFLDVAEHESFGEWRAIVPNRNDDPMTLKIKRQDVQRIYYSVMTPDSVVQELHDLVKHDLKFRHVALYRVLPDASYWRLTAEAITSE
jgi:hypothetical protein